MLRDKDKYVIWPAYIDKGNSRSGGRIISRKRSVTSPELEKDKAYPKSWWEVSGWVLVDKRGVK